MNGIKNTGRVYAFSGTIVIGISMAIFWYYAPSIFNYNLLAKRCIQFAGIGAMVASVLLCTPYHDLVTVIAGILGMVALILIWYGLYKRKKYFLFGLGLVNLIFILLNNYIYYRKHLFFYLPVIQKITFLLLLIWVCLLTLYMYRLSNSPLETLRVIASKKQNNT